MFTTMLEPKYGISQVCYVGYGILLGCISIILNIDKDQCNLKSHAKDDFLEVLMVLLINVLQKTNIFHTKFICFQLVLSQSTQGY